MGGHSAHTAFDRKHVDGKAGWKCSQKVSGVISFSLTELSEFRGCEWIVHDQLYHEEIFQSFGL